MLGVRAGLGGDSRSNTKGCFFVDITADMEVTAGLGGDSRSRG